MTIAKRMKKWVLASMLGCVAQLGATCSDVPCDYYYDPYTGDSYMDCYYYEYY